MGRARKVNDSASDRETKRLNEHLAKYDLWIKSIAEDGNCLFRAVADQVYGDTGRAREVREQSVAYILEHRDDFACFLDEADGSFEQYAETMAMDGTWGSQLELMAICQAYRMHMLIFQATTGDSYEMSFDSTDEDALCVLLAYIGGEHYQSVRLGFPSSSPSFSSSAVENQSLRRVRTEIYNSSRLLNLNDDKEQSTRRRVLDDPFYKQFVELLSDCLPVERADESLNNEALLVDYFRRYVWKDLSMESQPPEEESRAAASGKSKKAPASAKRKASGKKKTEEAARGSAAPQKSPPLGPQLDEGLSAEEVQQVMSGRVDDAVEAVLQSCMNSMG